MVLTHVRNSISWISYDHGNPSWKFCIAANYSSPDYSYNKLAGKKRVSLIHVCAVMNICAICDYVNISLANSYSVKTICTISDNGIDDWLIDWLIDWLLVFNATFSNISAIPWRPVLVVEEAGVPWENHRPWASNW